MNPYGYKLFFRHNGQISDSWSNYLFATAEVAYITAMIFIHIILHSAVHIYDFHIFIALSAELFTSTERVLTQRSNFTPQRAIVVPKSLSIRDGKLSGLLLFFAWHQQARVVSVLRGEEFLPVTSLLLNAQRKNYMYLQSWWRKIRSISSHLNLFANRQIEQPNTYKISRLPWDSSLKRSGSRP